MNQNSYTITRQLRFTKQQNEIDEQNKKLREDIASLENQIIRLQDVIQQKDLELIEKEKDMERESKLRVQAVAEYYQKKEQTLLKTVHQQQVSIISNPKGDNSTVFITQNTSYEQTFQYQLNTFLLAVELERFRSLYQEKERETNDMIVNS